MAESIDSKVLGRVARGLLLVALVSLLLALPLHEGRSVAQWIGVTALLLAPWAVLAEAIRSKSVAWPWLIALIGLAVVWAGLQKTIQVLSAYK